MKNKTFENWLDSQEVMQALHISPRTLQTMRTNGALPYSKIGNKIYYKHSDIAQILENNYTTFKTQPHESNQ